MGDGDGNGSNGGQQGDSWEGPVAVAGAPDTTPSQPSPAAQRLLTGLVEAISASEKPNGLSGASSSGPAPQDEAERTAQQLRVLHAVACILAPCRSSEALQRLDAALNALIRSAQAHLTHCGAPARGNKTAPANQQELLLACLAASSTVLAQAAALGVDTSLSVEQVSFLVLAGMDEPARDGDPPLEGTSDKEENPAHGEHVLRVTSTLCTALSAAPALGMSPVWDALQRGCASPQALASEACLAVVPGVARLACARAVEAFHEDLKTPVRTRRPKRRPKVAALESDMSDVESTVGRLVSKVRWRAVEEGAGVATLQEKLALAVGELSTVQVNWRECKRGCSMSCGLPGATTHPWCGVHSRVYCGSAVTLEICRM